MNQPDNWRWKIGAAAVILVSLLAILQYFQPANRTQDNDIATLSSRLDALEANTAAILDRLNEPTRSEPNEPQEALEPAFEPWPIPLDPQLQAHTYMRSVQTGIPPDLIYAIMWTESGMEWHEPVMDSNGYYSVGYCMINGINWSWLDELGIDVHTPEGNIDACIYILWMYREKGYSEEQMVAAYNAGESGMLRGGGVRYLNTVSEAMALEMGE